MSASPQVLKMVSDAFIARLANESTGFNANLVGVAQGYQITPYEIDFRSDRSKTFFKGRIDLATLEGSTALSQKTIMTLATPWARVTNETKFRTFSGQIGLVIEVWLSIKSQDPTSWDQYVQATFDALLQSLNDQDLLDWSTPVVYNYDLSFQAGMVVASREWWGQRLTFQASCEVHTS